MSVIASALDPRLRKVKFLSLDEVLKVQVKLKTLALQARNEKEQLPTGKCGGWPSQ